MPWPAIVCADDGRPAGRRLWCRFLAAAVLDPFRSCAAGSSKSLKSMCDTGGARPGWRGLQIRLVARLQVVQLADLPSGRGSSSFQHTARPPLILQTFCNALDSALPYLPLKRVCKSEVNNGDRANSAPRAAAAMAKRQDYDYLIKLLLIGDSGEAAGCVFSSRPGCRGAGQGGAAPAPRARPAWPARAWQLSGRFAPS